MSVLYIFVFLSLLYHHVSLVSVTSIRVSTQQGDVLGNEVAVQLHNGQTKTVYKFLGIPYAQSPIRFKPPQPLSSQSRPNDYDATYYRPICVQPNRNKYMPSIKRAWPGFDLRNNMREDCLFLNIYTPSTNCTRNYPVVVYIHGGSYVAGTPIRDVSPGEYLPTQGVVLVTIQYRLGAFGFFSTGDSEAPGNLGFLDQIEALKWIRDNIGGFCGNKSSVTLLGEGVGGSSVSLHYLSPLSKNLFHRGIAISGVGLAPFALKPKATVVNASKTLIKAASCLKYNSTLILQCLRGLSIGNLVNANTDKFNVQPFVDNYFLPDEPRKLLEKGNFFKLPLMSGFVRDEGKNGYHQSSMSNIIEYERYLDKYFFQKDLNFTKQQAPIAFDALSFQYTPWGDLTTSRAFRNKILDMRGEYLVVAPTHDVLTFHSNHVAATYMFEFAHRSNRANTQEDTLPYIFGLPLLKSPRTDQLSFDASGRVVSNLMVLSFINFATSGIPGNIHGSRKQWTPFTASNEAYLKISKTRTTVMARRYSSLRVAFWNSYFPKLFECRKQKSWHGRCKKSETARPSQSPDDESNPATLANGAQYPELGLW
ncbi:cholinesterase 2-like [Actinia tenebrosa]|uniref:Cholinesterase 2-like n=1 Tax=Actinia tenebrosa TaxID=6105 RepID=A0A6P8HBK9_ACTTE|nr:cholinesterase 2-like [Actinia tenebrosa]